MKFSTSFLSAAAIALIFMPGTGYSARETQGLPGRNPVVVPNAGEPQTLRTGNVNPLIKQPSPLLNNRGVDISNSNVKTSTDEPKPDEQPARRKNGKKGKNGKKFKFDPASMTTQKALPKAPRAGAALTVYDTIYGVLRHHRELRGLQEDREVMERELKRAQAGFGPSVDIQGNAGTAVINDSSTRRHNKYTHFLGVLEVSAKLTQPIWDGFATRSRVRSAQSTLNSVKARVFDTATTLSLDGIIAQIDLLRRRVLYDLSKRNVETHRAILAQTEERSIAGADTEADVSQAQSRLARALSSLSEAQAALIVAEDTYTRLTGLPPAGNMQEVPMPPQLFDGPRPVLEMAEQHNPKIHSYMEDIRALQADKQLAKSTYYPTINLEVGPTHSNRNRYDDRWTSTFDVVGAFRWNLFNSGADYQEVKAANARIRESRQVLYNFMDTLLLDIQSTWANYMSAKDQYKHYSDAVEYNEFTRQAYLEQFQMGQRTLLDVLDAENELYNSATQAETAKGNILVGAYRLAALTGNLLPMMKIDYTPIELNPERDPKDPREEFDLGWFK